MWCYRMRRFRNFTKAARRIFCAPINAMRLILHPAGMGPRILNFAEWRAHSLSVLRQQIEARADPVIQSCMQK